MVLTKETIKTITTKPDGTVIETTAEKQKEVKSARTRWFRFVLYPDNIYHQQIMDYLNSEKNPYQGCYILHQPESDEMKEHWHVLLYFPNCRTKAGVIKMFGQGDFRKTDNGLEPCLDKTGVYEFELEVADLVGSALVEPVSDIHSTAMYFLHKTFAAIREGKTEYAISDFKAFHSDFELVNSLFELGKTTSAGSQLQEIIQYIDEYKIKTLKELVLTLYFNEPMLVKYVETHSYLIKNLF